LTRLERASPPYFHSVSFAFETKEVERLTNSAIFRHKQPWRDALIASTGLSVFVIAASLLWNSGHPEWAFALVFVAFWVLLSISWSNVDFTEKSGTILAGVMDHNFHQLNERLERLEQDLEETRARLEIESELKDLESYPETG
jgi:hypothetical protein